MFRVLIYIQWRTCLERYYTYSGKRVLGVIIRTVALSTRLSFSIVSCNDALCVDLEIVFSYISAPLHLIKRVRF